MTTMKRFFLICFLVAPTVGTRVYATEAPAYEDPPEAEQEVFDAKLVRLQGHAAQIAEGRKVTDMITSFTQEVTHTIECPNDRQVNVKINSKLNKWNKEIVKKRLTDGEKSVGACMADYPPAAFVDNKKTVELTFHIMLDPSVTVPDEADAPMGVMADEALLYHELLHGQLLINAIKTDQNWADKACNCQIDLTPLDANHATIYGWVEGFLNSLAGPDRTVSVRNIPAQTAENANGDFDIDLGSLDDLVGEKENLVTGFRLIDSSNIKNEPTANPPEPRLVAKENGHMHFRGKLIDPTKPGFALVRLDPPADFVFFGIEEAIVINPVIGGVPTLSVWGIVLLALLLLVVAKVYFGRRQRVEVDS